MQATNDNNHFWRNYVAHITLGGLQRGGMAFIAANTILPPLVETLGGSTWLIALMPAMMMMGVGWPPLFTAHWIDRMPRYMPVVIVTSILQRLPFLFAGLALLSFGSSHPVICLWAVAMAPFLYGFLGGTTIAAWQGIIAKTLPSNRRASSAGIQNIISSAIGIGAGVVVARTLAKSEGLDGYGILYLIAFGFIAVSFIALLFIKEEAVSPQETGPQIDKRGLVENLRTVPRLIREDVQLRNYVVSRCLYQGLFVVTPFLSIYALRTTGLPNSFLGTLIAAQMAGGVGGNLLAAYLGDRYGGKVVMVMGRVSALSICLTSVLVESQWGFSLVFFLLGLAQFANQVGTSTLSIELCPVDRRATYLAIMSAISAPSMLFASFLSARLWAVTDSFACVAVAGAILIGMSLIFLGRVVEPRRRTRPSQAAEGS